MNEEKSKMLKLTTDQIETKFGKGSIMKFGEGGHDLNIGVIPTGALPLDAALGIGGVPRGRIVEVYGPESSGKTTLALQIIAEAQAMGGIVGVHRRRTRARSGLCRRVWAWISTTCSSPSPTRASRRWRSATCSCVRGAIDLHRHRLRRRTRAPGGDRRRNWRYHRRACRRASCRRPCASWPARFRNRTPRASSSTSCARR